MTDLHTGFLLALTLGQPIPYNVPTALLHTGFLPASVTLKDSVGSKITAGGRKETADTKLEDDCFLEETYGKPRQYVKRQGHHFANKGPFSQGCGPSGSHIQM